MLIITLPCDNCPDATESGRCPHSKVRLTFDGPAEFADLPDEFDVEDVVAETDQEHGERDERRGLIGWLRSML
jgi:hypothetical protein